MGDVISRDDHVLMAKVTPSLRDLSSTDGEWWLGGISVQKLAVYADEATKTWPRFRIGYSHPVAPDVHFRVDAFQRVTGEAAYGVVLVEPSEHDETWVGWVEGHRGDDVKKWVDFLNAELRKLYELWAKHGYAGRK